MNINNTDNDSKEVSEQNKVMEEAVAYEKILGQL